MGLDVDEIKRHTQTIDDIEQAIRDEKRLGSSSTDENALSHLSKWSDWALDDKATKARAERKIDDIKERYADIKPADMHWADFIKQLATQAREKLTAKKISKMKSKKANRPLAQLERKRKSENKTAWL